jgi:hypothetical protein
MLQMTIDTWLYGNLARYGGPAAESSFANVQVTLQEGATMQDLLSILQIPSHERGITFINGNLSAMPGMQPDLEHILHDGDRVAFFHLLSMWPFQYRFGVAMIPEMSAAMQSKQDQGLHHSYSGGK